MDPMDKKVGDELVVNNNEVSVDEVKLDDGEVNEFVHLLENKMDDFSNNDNQLQDKAGGFRVKELDEHKKHASDGKDGGKARAHTLRQISMARKGLEVFDTDSISLWQIMTKHTSSGDTCFLVLGTFAAIIFGLCFPAFFYYFG